MAIRILIIDDHRLFRAGLRTLLAPDSNFEIVGEATNGAEGIQLASELCPDVILLDMGMPGMDGLEATRQLVPLVRQSKILIMTMHEDSELVKECLRAGASGYIVKRAAESELVDAVYAVWRGMIYIHPSLVSSIVTSPAPGVPQKPKEIEPLSGREIEILRLIVQGYTNRQISHKLFISVRTVESHRSNIMGKLDLHSRVDLVRYAMENGLGG